VPEDFEPPSPATLDDHAHVTGPFLHGTRAALAPGDLVVPGRPSHFRPDRPLAHVYFTTRLETAAWGAELAAALAPDADVRAQARVYEVEPTGPFEDDPNVTDKKFPGNPTRSYRCREPLRVVAEVSDWPQHSPEELDAMVAGLARLRAQGLDVVYD
jgi:rifampin ADP-ribosylating transferase